MRAILVIIYLRFFETLAIRGGSRIFGSFSFSPTSHELQCISVTSGFTRLSTTTYMFVVALFRLYVKFHNNRTSTCKKLQVGEKKKSRIFLAGGGYSWGGGGGGGLGGLGFSKNFQKFCRRFYRSIKLIFRPFPRH